MVDELLSMINHAIDPEEMDEEGHEEFVDWTTAYLNRDDVPLPLDEVNTVLASIDDQLDTIDVEITYTQMKWKRLRCIRDRFARHAQEVAIPWEKLDYALRGWTRVSDVKWATTSDECHTIFVVEYHENGEVECNFRREGSHRGSATFENVDDAIVFVGAWAEPYLFTSEPHGWE